MPDDYVKFMSCENTVLFVLDWFLTSSIRDKYFRSQSSSMSHFAIRLYVCEYQLDFFENMIFEVEIALI